MFCRNCGTQLADDGRFCSKCGTQVNENNQQANPNNTHQVTIFRESQIYLVNPPINISMNGKKNLSIPNGGTLELHLEDGHYEFEFSCSMRKRKVTLDLCKDTLIKLKWNRFTGSLMAEVE